MTGSTLINYHFNGLVLASCSLLARVDLDHYTSAFYIILMYIYGSAYSVKSYVYTIHPNCFLNSLIWKGNQSFVILLWVCLETDFTVQILFPSAQVFLGQQFLKKLRPAAQSQILIPAQTWANENKTGPNITLNKEPKK